jgi:hypothetical protein
MESPPGDTHILANDEDDITDSTRIAPVGLGERREGEEVLGGVGEHDRDVGELPGEHRGDLGQLTADVGSVGLREHGADRGSLSDSLCKR